MLSDAFVLVLGTTVLLSSEERLQREMNVQAPGLTVYQMQGILRHCIVIMVRSFRSFLDRYISCTPFSRDLARFACTISVHDGFDTRGSVESTSQHVSV